MLLAWELQQYGNVHIFGNNQSQTPSLQGAAIISPIANKNNQIVENFTQKQEKAIRSYKQISKCLGKTYIHPLPLIRAATPSIDKHYLDAWKTGEKEKLEAYWNWPQQMVKVANAVKIDTAIVSDLRAYFKQKNQYHIQQVNTHIPEFWNHLLLQYDAIFLCEGTAAKHNAHYLNWKLTPNKGDIIHMHCPGLPAQYIYDWKYKIVPMKNDIFWLGSNNIWNYTNVTPEANWLNDVQHFLNMHLKQPYQIIKHFSIERPTIAGQVPKILPLNTSKTVWAVNGLGTRGYSNGPSIVHALVLEWQAATRAQKIK